MSAHQRFSTTGLAPNHEFGYWREVIGDAYFNLQLTFPTSEHFTGNLDAWNLESMALSRLESSALRYRRLSQHCKEEDRQILVTVPLQSEVEFTQLGRHLRCKPGQFLLEYSDEPYEFSYGAANTLWVLKVPEAALQARLGNASRYCAREYEANDGVGRVFREYIQLLATHCGNQDAKALSLMGTQIIDLLALSLSQGSDSASSQQSSVRAAHCARVEAYIRNHLFDSALAPQPIADACGISLRYLHALVSGEGQSVAEMIRVRRLHAAHEQLGSAAPLTSIAQIAYSCGFSDQAQFSRQFRQHYGLTPSDYLRQRRLS